jgi:hypothetical protein
MVVAGGGVAAAGTGVGSCAAACDGLGSVVGEGGGGEGDGDVGAVCNLTMPWTTPRSATSDTSDGPAEPAWMFEGAINDHALPAMPALPMP